MPSRVVSGIQQTLDQNTETALGTSGLEQALLRPPFLLETVSKVEDSELSHLTDTPIPPIQLLQASKGQHPAISVPEVKWDFQVTLLSKKKKKNEGREGGRKGKKEREEGRKGRKERGKERGKKGEREKKGKKVQNSKQPATGFAQMPPGQGWRTESLRAPGKRGSWFFFQQNASFHTDATSVSLKSRPRRHVDAWKNQDMSLPS